MSFATLFFAGWNYFVLGGICVALILAFSIWSYYSAQAGRRKWLLLALKLAGVVALAFCLLEPLWSGQRVRPGANLFAIVADNSQGLQIKDRGETRSRADLLCDLLNPQLSRWQGTLQENFEVRRHYFDSR